MPRKTQDYDGGLVVSSKLKKILGQSGFISVKMGGQTAHSHYRKGTTGFNPERLSPFGLLCFLGALDAVKKEVESKEAPPLSNTETPYKWGYAMLVLFGAERLIPDDDPSKYRHLATLQYLISQGLPVDATDIAGWTALTHAAMTPRSQLEITKTLLEAGANPNHQGRYGDVPLFGAIEKNNYEEADLLLQYNADLDIPEADGLTPRTVYTNGGPRIAAVFQKHIPKREGKDEAPRMEKSCDHCKKTDIPLRNCAKCRVARYCGVECQRAAWPTHKQSCQPFNESNTATSKPHYEQHGSIMPMAQVRREVLGTSSEPITSAQSRGAHVPKSLQSTGQTKNIIIKVQVPPGDSNIPLLVYTKKRDFVCMLRHQDQPASYDRVARIVREKGVAGMKAYFAAELKSKDELIVKISEVLAAQPF